MKAWYPDQDDSINTVIYFAPVKYIDYSEPDLDAATLHLHSSTTYCLFLKVAFKIIGLTRESFGGFVAHFCGSVERPLLMVYLKWLCTCQSNALSKSLEKKYRLRSWW